MADQITYTIMLTCEDCGEVRAVAMTEEDARTLPQTPLEDGSFMVSGPCGYCETPMVKIDPVDAPLRRVGARKRPPKLEVKIASVAIVTIEVVCPHCREGVEHPDSGSLNWEVIAIYDQLYSCQNCQKYFRMPKRIGGIPL